MVRHAICTCERIHVTYQETGAEVGVVEGERGEREEREEGGHRFWMQDWTESHQEKFTTFEKTESYFFQDD